MRARPSPETSAMPADSSPIHLAFMGASNLARGYRALASALGRRLAPSPVACYAALGPGRGYVAPGGLWNIVYPPISECGLVDALRERVAPGSRLVALLSDIGNDIMYDVPAGDILASVEKIIDDISCLEGSVVVTPIPLDIRRDVSEKVFHILRRAFYPRSQVTYEQTERAVIEINQRLFMLRSPRVRVIEGMQAFRGFDKIHYSVLNNAPAWSRVGEAMLDLLGGPGGPPLAIGQISMMRSFVCNIGRVIFRDACGLGRRPADLF